MLIRFEFRCVDNPNGFGVHSTSKLTFDRAQQALEVCA